MRCPYIQYPFYNVYNVMQVSAMRNGETHLVFSLPKRDAKRCLKNNFGGNCIKRSVHRKENN